MSTTMATVALSRPLAPHRPVSSIATLSSPILENINTHANQCPVTPVPNKHIPVCPPGPVPQNRPNTPPPSPGKDDDHCQASLLFPPDKFPVYDDESPALYRVTPDQVADALDFQSRQPMPDPSLVFPWLHGLHPHNQIQMTFFSRRRGPSKTPNCLRGIVLVQADGDLSTSRLKGAVAPAEVLQPGSPPEFLAVDPKEGFSVRNFHIQVAKCATVSDIIVYGSDEPEVRQVASDMAHAQCAWREKHEAAGHSLPTYNTFICVEPFFHFERCYPTLVAVDSAGQLTGNVLSFADQERSEMYAMTKASEISHNVWLGPSLPEEEEERYDVLVECTDMGRLSHERLQAICEGSGIRRVDFPSSGSILAPTWSHADTDAILESCKWIWHIAHGTHPSSCLEQGNPRAQQRRGRYSGVERPPRKVLIHCADGYTESTMLAIAYYSYSTAKPVPEAWLDLHNTKQRNFFAYPTDVALLTAIAPRLLRESPVCADKSLSAITAALKNEPRWLAGLDGSLPSRVTSYMYLGNLGHANNPDLLRALGIRQILSVGEMAMWPDGELEDWGPENTCTIQGVQDNGIDPLTDELERCLEFIDRGRSNGTATLVHCRVGVSRSATICIAEVMRAMGMSFPRAYCYVRARRLNVIIQPHLRFAYELVKWEEELSRRRVPEFDHEGPSIKRELEWAEIAREIALMNRPYAR